MDSINFLLIFDVIILGYGFYIIAAAVKMDRTKIPAGMLVSREELTGSRDPEGFCGAMAKKTLVLGICCVLFGLISGIGEIYIKSRIFSGAVLTLFLITVLWYCNEMRSARSAYIK